MWLPDWRTFTGGTRSRVALWLAAEVGAGGHFTKSQLREAFPAVEQIDRRMRDLRPEGWVINTYREDPGLAADELRLVSIGGAVWENGYRSKQNPISDKARKAALVANDYMCTLCGISAGEAYPDSRLRRARLLVRRQATNQGASSLRTVCERCSIGTADVDSAGSLLADAANLTQTERSRLSQWIVAGARPWAREDRLWSRYCRLSPGDREEVARRLQ